jgi:acetyl-CoA C-acetyltransferase
MQQKVYITTAVRTAIGNFGGSLKDYSAPAMGATLINDIIKQNNISNTRFDGIIIGNVLQAGIGQNPARQAALGAGLDYDIPCLTINKVCGSGMKAVDIAFNYILSGAGNLYISGGIESMSNCPYLSKSARWGSKLGDATLIDDIIFDGLWCPYNKKHMGELVESLAADYGITRKHQDEFAFLSNQKAINAIKNNRFKDEIVPIEIKNKKSAVMFDTDERPREDTTLEKLSSLKPAFLKEGNITAGNSSGINDGAALLLIASQKAVDFYGLNPIAEIISVAETGLEPALFGIAPVAAARKACEQAKINISDIKLFEFNEAFAAQSLCVLKDLKIDPELVNVNGGAVALGHPIGASGARIIVTLLHEMLKEKITYGLASLCIGSGEAMAVIIKNVSGGMS